MISLVSFLFLLILSSCEADVKKRMRRVPVDSAVYVITSVGRWTAGKRLINGYRIGDSGIETVGSPYERVQVPVRRERPKTSIEVSPKSERQTKARIR